ncbi:unnamed protein product, partial [marine sediment metagenome]
MGFSAVITDHTELNGKEAAGVIDHADGSITNAKIEDGTIDLTAKATYIPVNRAGDKLGGNLDFDRNFPLRMNLRHFVHMTLEHGVTDIVLESIPAGILEQDFHIYKVAASVDAAPGEGNTVTTSVTNGTGTMTVSITGATDTSGSTTTGVFDVDVSAQTLTLKYTQD